MQTLTVVKIGGNIVDNPDKLDDFLSVFNQIAGPKILVHGGGKIATSMASKLGVESEMIQGRRVTNAQTLPITVMVYAGLVNKNIVAKLQHKSCDAIGFCGADARLIISQKRSVSPIDYGFVGDFKAKDVNVVRLGQFLKMGLVPVFSAITCDISGQLLNTNADTIASNLAIALANEFIVNLIYCFELKGVLVDINQPDSVIEIINHKNFEVLKEQGIINQGMLPKIENALAAIDQNVNKVCIKQADDLLDSLAGTTIQG